MLLSLKPAFDQAADGEDKYPYDGLQVARSDASGRRKTLAWVVSRLSVESTLEGLGEDIARENFCRNTSMDVFLAVFRPCLEITVSRDGERNIPRCTTCRPRVYLYHERHILASKRLLK